jgi:Holliday junction resolvase
MKKDIYIIKADGTKELFSETKLRRSLHRVNASKEIIDELISQLKSELKDGMNTSAIYRRAFSLLRKYQYSAADRYQLKNAIIKLGPSGYPFEKLISELLKSEGYKTEVAVRQPGLCVSHEIDVIAKKGNQCIMVECKFHNEAGIKSDVKAALYVWARFLDLQNRWKKYSGSAQKFDQAWLVTNTKLTTDATNYASCVGMKVIGWNYPPEHSLQILLERSSLYPITALINLSESIQKQLIEQNIVTCKELLRRVTVLKKMKINNWKISKILREIDVLCKY